MLKISKMPEDVREALLERNSLLTEQSEVEIDHALEEWSAYEIGDRHWARVMLQRLRSMSEKEERAGWRPLDLQEDGDFTVQYHEGRSELANFWLTIRLEVVRGLTDQHMIDLMVSVEKACGEGNLV